MWSKQTVLITELSNNLDYVTSYYQKPIKEPLERMNPSYRSVPPHYSTPLLSPLQSLDLFQSHKCSKIFPTTRS